MLRRVLGISLCAVLLSLVILTQRFPRMDPDELDPSADQMREEKWLQKERTWLTQAKRRGISKGKGKAVSNIQELWRKDNLGGLGLDRIRLPGDKDSTVAPAFAFDSAADLSKRWTRQSGANPCWWIRNQSRCLPVCSVLSTSLILLTYSATAQSAHSRLMKGVRLLSFLPEGIHDNRYNEGRDHSSRHLPTVSPRSLSFSPERAIFLQSKLWTQVPKGQLPI
eukprot:SAG31_NODE_285_length_18479_cov_9.871980_3_plen_223_part_00